MRSPVALALALLCWLPAAIGSGRADTLPGPIPAVVLRVIDGDTLLVRARIWLGQEVVVRVRLAGIDTPEINGRCAAESAAAARARDYLAALVAGGSVALTEIGPDKYGGRVGARASVAGRCGASTSRTWPPKRYAR